jgi:hypothetical protein
MKCTPLTRALDLDLALQLGIEIVLQTVVVTMKI